MVIKLIKNLLFLSLIAVSGYYVYYSQSPQNAPASSEKNMPDNSSNTIKYVKNFKGGVLTLMADKARVVSPDHIYLENMNAIFNKDGSEVMIKGGSCDIKTKEQKAYINENVIIKTANTLCNTESATVDFLNNALYGDSKVEGTRSGSKFVAQGFSLGENSEIKLKRAKIKKGN